MWIFISCHYLLLLLVFVVICSYDYVDQFWLRLKRVHYAMKFGVDDQYGINMALDRMGVKWNQMNNGYYEGHTTSGNTTLTITVLPQSVICRKNCSNELLKQYYVWHKYVVEKVGMAKRASMIVDRVWILNDNWNASLTDGTLKAEQWLMNITRPRVYNMSYNPLETLKPNMHHT